MAARAGGRLTSPAPPFDDANASTSALQAALDARDRLATAIGEIQADFASYRRRVERERAADADSARGDAIQALLPVLDDLDRALAHIPADLVDHPWARGVLLIGVQLQGVLHTLGVERIDAVGVPFEPAIHEAVAHGPHPGVLPGRVVAVARAGYRVGERLLRPAQVVVASEGMAGPPDAAADASEWDSSPAVDEPPAPRGTGSLVDWRV